MNNASCFGSHDASFEEEFPVSCKCESLLGFFSPPVTVNKVTNSERIVTEGKILFVIVFELCFVLLFRSVDPLTADAVFSCIFACHIAVICLRRLVQEHFKAEHRKREVVPHPLKHQQRVGVSSLAFRCNECACQRKHFLGRGRSPPLSGFFLPRPNSERCMGLPPTSSA